MKNNLPKKVIISCFLAACLEMYDFALFGFFTEIFHKNYLSFLDEANALIITYALFAVGFIFRPIGSIIFGHIGDIHGRKKALIASVTIMGTASLGMCLLPSYAMVGILSCYMIAFFRILQGISVGGEYSGALIYAIEHFDKKKTGIIGGIVISGCITGALIATLVSKIVSMPSLPDYSWRFAFLLGSGLSLIGYFIRKNLVETPEFNLYSSTGNRSKIPLLEGIKNYPLESIGSVFTAAANGVNFYFILVFLPRYINGITSLSIDYYPLITTIILILLSPAFAYLSDKVDRRKLIQNGLLILAVYSFVGLQIVKLYPSYISALVFFIVHAIIYSTQAATVNIFIIEIFPPKYRYSCSSFCYSIGLGVIGGSSPLVATIIIENFKEDANLYISCYMALICFIGYLSTKIVSLKNKLVINNS